MPLRLEEISLSSCLETAELLKDEPYFFWLDSAAKGALSGYSYLGFSPKKVLDCQSFAELENLEKDYFQENSPYPFFSGGALVEIDYESLNLEGKVAFKKKSPYKLAPIRIAIYESLIIFDHQSKKSFLSYRKAEKRQEFKEKLSALPKKNSPFSVKDLHWLSSKENYLASLDKIQEQLKKGEIYQANFTHSLEANFSGCPFAFYKALRQFSPAPFAAFLSRPSYQLCSASPELFLQRQKETLTSHPIKGTRARSSCPKKDLELRQELFEAEKDSAELNMIIDLIRNDL